MTTASALVPPLELTQVPVIKAILTRHRFVISKKLGQNFLIDRGVLSALVEAAHVEGEDVLEIGPGLGVLTRELVARAATVTAVEVATRLAPILAESLGDRSNLRILFADFLHVSTDTLGPGPFILASNLPYAITTPALFRFLDGDIAWKRIAVTVQAELAERIASGPGSREYGALSIAAQSAATVKIVRRIPSSSFWPRPKVESAIVLLEPRDVSAIHGAATRGVIARGALRELLRHAFSARRKTLRNALGRIAGAVDAVRDLGIDAEARPERIAVEEWIALATAIGEEALVSRETHRSSRSRQEERVDGSA